MTIKHFLLQKKITRTILFVLFHKKVNRKKIDKKIDVFCRQKQNMTAKAKLRVQKNLIVSLTSFPARITEVQYTVFSMLCQTVMPEKIILWLADSQFPQKEHDLPPRLLALCGELFEIHWCDDLRSYKKLIPAIRQFPEKDIVICDDDIFYRRNTVQYLIEEHNITPKDVICHIGKQMVFSNDGNVMPYEKWIWSKQCVTRKDVLPIGAGIVLYPYEVLNNSPLLLQDRLFNKLAYYADDIWFWYSIVNAGYSITIPKKTYKKMIYTNPEREYGISGGLTLAKLNEGEHMNDKQLKAIEEFFCVKIIELMEKQI